MKNTFTIRKSRYKVANKLLNTLSLKQLVSVVLTTVTITVGIGFSVQARASSDWYCGSNFTLDNRTYNECQVNFPTLDTGNDTQTNLYLLLADKDLIDFEVPKEADPNTVYGYYDFPLNLQDLKSTAVNKRQNPAQDLPKETIRRFYNEYCHSFQSGEAALRDVLNQDTNLTESERDRLMRYRQINGKKCINRFEEPNLFAYNKPIYPQKWSDHAKPYADYILASRLFYQGNKAGFDYADTVYRNLNRELSHRKIDDNIGLFWLNETANYMLIRTGLNGIYYSGMGVYSFKRENLDLKRVADTQEAIDSYLNRFAKGRYVASAQGLKRRLYWLIGRRDELIGEIEWQMNHPQSPRFNLDSRTLSEEIDRRIFSGSYHQPLDINQLNDPVLLTSFALSKLRLADDESSNQPLTLVELKQLKPKFADDPNLYQYLLATYYFVQQNDPKQALQHLPTDLPTDKLSYLNFSQYALVAKSLAALGLQSEADIIWHSMHSLPKRPYQQNLTDLALALEADRNNDYSALFGKEASVQSPALKMQVIQYSADPKLLSQIADSHSATNRFGAEARYALLTKSLMHGQYADFLRYGKQYLPKNFKDYIGYDSKNDVLKVLPRLSEFDWQGKTISSNIKCADLTAIVTKLSKTPDDRLQKTCLAEFIAATNVANYIDNVYDNYAKNYYQADDNETGYRYPYLGEIPSRFDGQALNRLALYQSVFADNKKDELSAYALHRAIECYASSARNHCGGKGVDLSVRKAWFKQLKANYSNTSWGKNQKYYW